MYSCVLHSKAGQTHCCETSSNVAGCWWQGGDLKYALKGLGDRPKQLQWYRQGSSIALDIIKGIHFLHMHRVRLLLQLTLHHSPGVLHALCPLWALDWHSLPQYLQWTKAVKTELRE